MEFPFRLPRPVPWLTLALVLTCLAATLPQFLGNENYSALTGFFPGWEGWYLLFLPFFTHCPDFLWSHFGGNVLAILVFGGMTERLLGARRFSLVTVATLAATLLTALWHSDGSDVTHGASGIVFGFVAVFGFVLLVLVERKAWSTLRKPWVAAAGLFWVYVVVISPIEEMVLGGQVFYANFGRTLHLVAFAVASGLVAVWRRPLERAVVHWSGGGGYPVPVRPRGPGVLVLAGILAFQPIAILSVLASRADPQQFSVFCTPGPTEPGQILGTEVAVRFDSPMVVGSDLVVLKALPLDGPPLHSVSTHWEDPRNLKVLLNRPTKKGQSLSFDILVSQRGPFGQIHRRTVSFNYR